MDKNNRNKTGKLICLLLAAMLLFPYTAFASVGFTKEKTGPSGSIYVAGNPDLYPLESFNKSAGEYEGMATELLRRISEKTGIDFIYVEASAVNRQQKLGENRQVELLTAYTGETGDWCKGEEAVCTFESDGKRYTARFCFTSIIPEEQYRKIVDAFYEVSGEEMNGWTVSYAMKKNDEQKKKPLTVAAVLFFAAAVLVCLVTLVIVLKNRKTAEIDKWLDPLTGRGNRNYFLDRYPHMVTDATRHSYYLVYYEFDIAWVNRCVGRDAAEELLRSMAAAFPDDTEKRISCRIEGGELADLMEAPGIESVREITGHNARLFNEKAKALTGENGVTVNASVLALESVFCNGKNALRYAKHAIAHEDSPSVTLCSEASLHELLEDSELGGQIRPALENCEFVMLIQPVFDVADGKMQAGEVLARWDHPERGRLKPSRFLERIREMKLTLEFDCYMLEKTCAQLETWEKEGKGNLSLAMYFCMETLLRRDFPEKFSETIQKYSFEHSRLCVIVSEEMVEKDPERIAAVIRKLHRQNFGVMLNAFGMGHTSIVNLTSLSLDIVKLERETIALLTKVKGKQMLYGVTGLLHSMGCKVMFQGIETKEQREAALDCGCDYMQGYYYARPMPPEEAILRMREEK